MTEMTEGETRRINTFEVGPDEAERMAALRAQGILDTQPSECFDRITSLLSRVLECSIAVVCFTDSERHWFKSSVGLGSATETHRNEAFCSRAILPGAPDVTVVLDASTHEDYLANPVVTGPPFVRFYAGSPIKVKHGGKVYKLGTVCVVDKVPRVSFSMRDKQFLMDMACIVADEIELFRGLSDRVMEENQRYITCTAHDLKTPLQVFRLATELFKEHFQSQLQEDEAEAAAAAAAVAEAAAEFAEEKGSSLSSATTPKSTPSSFSSSLSEDEPPPGSVRITTRTRSLFARSLHDTQAAASAAAAAAASTAELLDVAVQAEGACDMMDETVCNAIDAARARWTCNGENRGGDASNSSGFLEVDLAALVGDCRRLSAWHHGEAVGWTVEVAPEVIDTQIPH